MTDSGHDKGWRLDELLAEGADIGKALSEMNAKASEIESLRGALSPDMDAGAFASAISKVEEFSRIGAKLMGYAVLRFSADTQDQEALALLGRMEQAVTEAHNRILFLSLWWKGLDEQNARRLIGARPDIEYYLDFQRLFTKHTLSETEERLINIKDLNGVSALTTLYDIITNKFTYTIELDGERRTMSRDELTAYVRHPLPDVREAAYRELYRVFSAEATVLGQIYLNRCRDWGSEQVGMRKFESPIAVRNLSNDIPGPVVDTLLDVCAAEAPLFHRYFRLKASRLGLEKLRRFDLYAPLSRHTSADIPFDRAKSMVLESFGAFDPLMRSHAERVFDDNHMDSPARPGKRGGAFCYSVTPEMAPWVLLNYTGEPRDVATLAHELGHAVHSLMASGHSVLDFHSALPLAETASVFGEMLLMDRLLAETTDAEARRDLLIGSLDDMYATVLRQAFFVRFEREAHELVSDNATVDRLSECYMENLRLQFGDSMDIDPVFRHEWISIPHIYHTPFYCYAYSFGMLLSLSLYQRYKTEGSAFAPVLMRILSHGGSASPALILNEAGVDMKSASFWKGGFRVIEEMLERLESA